MTDSNVDKIGLEGSECVSCHTVFFPKKHGCPICAKLGTMKSKKLGSRGTLFSFSSCSVPLPGLMAPYLVGLVALPDGPRILGRIETNTPEQVKVGEEIEVVVTKPTTDQTMPGAKYVLRPTKREV